MNILSVINYKGGVGKTTLTANIAANLALKGKKVLIVDLDPQTNLTLSFITLKEWEEYALKGKTIKDWYTKYIEGLPQGLLDDLIIIPDKINQVLDKQSTKGCVHLISSHFDLIDIDMDLIMKLCGYTPREQKRNTLTLYSRLKEGLAQIKNKYDVILIDCPPNFNVVTRNAIVASDGYIIPVKPDYLSTLGIDQLERHVTKLTTEYNKSIVYDPHSTKKISPKSLGVIFTMVENNKKHEPINDQKQYIVDVKKKNPTTFNSYIRIHNKSFAGAPDLGIPVVLQRSTKSDIIINQLKAEFEMITSELLEKLK